MQPSAKCLELIKRSEGLRLKPYRDLAGYWTVGYGHKLSGAALEVGGRTHVIDEAMADELLLEDAEWAAGQVGRMVHVPLTQGQLDALVDFVFNLGAERLASSTLLKLLNLGNYRDAGQQLLRWNIASWQPQPGLTVRRQAELSLWEGV